jgi:hypothetical protein
MTPRRTKTAIAADAIKRAVVAEATKLLDAEMAALADAIATSVIAELAPYAVATFRAHVLAGVIERLSVVQTEWDAASWEEQPEC